VKPSIRTLLLATLMLPLLHACGGNGDEDGGSVRVVNATSDFGSIDAYRDDDWLTGGVSPGTGSGYVNLDKDDYPFKISKSGLTSTAASVTGGVDAGKHYALLTYSTGASLQVNYVQEDEGSPNSGQAKMRFMNTAAIEAGTLDVYVGHTACNALGPADLAVATNLSTTALTGFGAYAAGTYTVCVTAYGDKTDVRLSIPSLGLSNQQVATLVFTRSRGGVLVHGLMVNQQGSVDRYDNPSSRVRVVSNPLSGNITTQVNGTTVGSLQTPGSIGTYRLVPAGALAITANGTAVDAGSATAPAGGDLTLLFTGNGAAPTLSVITDDNTPSTSTSKPAKLRMLNAVNGLTGGATLVLDSDVIADNVASGTASPAITVATSASLADLAANSGGTLLWEAKDKTLGPGKVYTVFLLGDTASVGTASKMLADR